MLPRRAQPCPLHFEMCRCHHSAATEPPPNVPMQRAAEPEAEAQTGGLAVGTLAAESYTGQKLADFVVERRAGKRVSLPGYYGCNSAVFHVHPVRRPARLLTMKVVYNVEEVGTNDLLEHFRSDFEFQDRLPPHPAILPVLHHFTDTASQLTLGRSWDADPEFTRAGSLFVLMERMEQTLKQLITTRQQDGREPPFFSAAEFLQVGDRRSGRCSHSSRQSSHGFPRETVCLWGSRDIAEKGGRGRHGGGEQGEGKGGGGAAAEGWWLDQLAAPAAADRRPDHQRCSPPARAEGRPPRPQAGQHPHRHRRPRRARRQAR